MAYTLDINLNLGAANTGLTLEALLVNTAGASVGSAVTTGFTEIGGGNYLWHYAAWPDGHRGGVIFRLSPAGAVKAFVSINPEEVENTDAKTSAVPTAVWALGSRTLTSFGTLVADTVTAVWGAVSRTLTAFGFGVTVTSNLDKTGYEVDVNNDKTDYELADDAVDADQFTQAAADKVWDSLSRTLTQTVASIAGSQVGSSIVIRRGDSLTASLTGLPDLTSVDKLWFTFKEDAENDKDTQSLLQVELAAGLLFVARRPALDSSLGSITLDSATAITIAIDPPATKHLPVVTGTYDVQSLVGTTVTTLTSGVCSVTADTTRATD